MPRPETRYICSRFCVYISQCSDLCTNRMLLNYLHYAELTLQICTLIAQMGWKAVGLYCTKLTCKSILWLRIQCDCSGTDHTSRSVQWARSCAIALALALYSTSTKLTVDLYTELLRIAQVALALI
jgi:hypothetical protein